MSLESQIAELVSATNALVNTFNTKKKEIDQAVLAAINAAPDLRRVIFIDQTSGADTNTGARASPYKTITAAMAAVPICGIADLRLLSDYVLDTLVFVEYRYVRLSGDGGIRKLSVRYFQKTTGDQTATLLSGFLQGSGQCQFELQDIELVLPSSSGVLPVPVGHHVSVFKTNQFGGAPILSVKLSGGKLTAPDDFIGWLAASPNAACILEVAQMIFPAAFGGKYIFGVATGTNPLTLSNVITNLTTL